MTKRCTERTPTVTRGNRLAETPGPRDREWIDRAQAGEPLAGEWLERRLLDIPRYLRLIDQRYGRALGAHDLDDVAQEAMLKAWRKLDRFTGHGAFGAWLYRFCMLEYLNSLRRHNRAPRLQALDSEMPAKVRPAMVHVEELVDRLHRLEPEHARLLELRHVHGLGFHEIGSRLGVTIAAARNRYYRSLRSLREHLGVEKREGKHGDSAR